MTAISSLAKTLFSSQRLSRQVQNLRKNQPQPESVRNDKFQRADFVGQPLGVLNEVESAQVSNDIAHFRKSNGIPQGQSLNIPVLRREDGNRDWPLTRQVMARHRDNSFFGTQTGMPTYDDFLNQSGRAADKGKDVEIIRMTPQEYITFATNTLQARQVPEGLEELTEAGVRSSRGGEHLDTIMSDMIEKGDFDVPVLDYTDMSQEGLHRAIAAEKLGIREMPVMVVRSNLPVEMTQEVGSEAEFMRMRQIGGDGEEKGFLLAAREGKNTFKVVESELEPAFRGRGLGLEMYEEMANAILRSGGKFASDQVVSGDAQRVWESMERIGYLVVRNKNVRMAGQSLNESAARGGILKSMDGEPVYTITRLPRRPQDEWKPKAKNHVVLESSNPLENERLRNLERAQSQQNILTNDAVQAEDDMVDLRVSRDLLQQLKDLGLDINIE